MDTDAVGKSGWVCSDKDLASSDKPNNDSCQETQVQVTVTFPDHVELDPHKSDQSVDTGVSEDVNVETVGEKTMVEEELTGNSDSEHPKTTSSDRPINGSSQETQVTVTFPDLVELDPHEDDQSVDMGVCEDVNVETVGEKTMVEKKLTGNSDSEHPKTTSSDRQIDVSSQETQVTVTFPDLVELDPHEDDQSADMGVCEDVNVETVGEKTMVEEELTGNSDSEYPKTKPSDILLTDSNVSSSDDIQQLEPDTVEQPIAIAEVNDTSDKEEPKLVKNLDVPSASLSGVHNVPSTDISRRQRKEAGSTSLPYYRSDKCAWEDYRTKKMVNSGEKLTNPACSAAERLIHPTSIDTSANETSSRNRDSPELVITYCSIRKPTDLSIQKKAPIGKTTEVPGGIREKYKKRLKKSIEQAKDVKFTQKCQEYEKMMRTNEEDFNDNTDASQTVKTENISGKSLDSFYGESRCFEHVSKILENFASGFQKYQRSGIKESSQSSSEETFLDNPYASLPSFQPGGGFRSERPSNNLKSNLLTSPLKDSNSEEERSEPTAESKDSSIVINSSFRSAENQKLIQIQNLSDPSFCTIIDENKDYLPEDPTFSNLSQILSGQFSASLDTAWSPSKPESIHTDVECITLDSDEEFDIGLLVEKIPVPIKQGFLDNAATSSSETEQKFSKASSIAINQTPLDEKDTNQIPDNKDSDDEMLDREVAELNIDKENSEPECAKNQLDYMLEELPSKQSDSLKTENRVQKSKRKYSSSSNDDSSTEQGSSDNDEIDHEDKGNFSKKKWLANKRRCISSDESSTDQPVPDADESGTKEKDNMGKRNRKKRSKRLRVSSDESPIFLSGSDTNETAPKEEVELANMRNLMKTSKRKRYSSVSDGYDAQQSPGTDETYQEKKGTGDETENTAKTKYEVQSFFDEEAEMSGDDHSSDEDENKLDEDMILKDTIDNTVFNNQDLVNEIAPVHMKHLMDEDTEALKKVQNMFLNDGEYHTDGASRKRNYTWTNTTDSSKSEAMIELSSDSELEENMQGANSQQFLKWKQANKDEENVGPETSNTIEPEVSVHKKGWKMNIIQDETKTVIFPDTAKKRGSILNAKIHLQDVQSPQQEGGTSTKHFLFSKK